MSMDIKKTHVPFKRIEEMCSIMHQQIQADGFEPDLLISIARGGCFPGDILASELMFNNRYKVTVNVASYDHSNQQRELKLLLPVHTEDYKDFKSILVVDDIADTGDTLKFVTELLKKDLTSGTIKTAVLFYKLKSKVKPDYYVEETEDWIVFPWEK
jgi:hypoxanthine phosphoribosyltransferase